MCSDDHDVLMIVQRVQTTEYIMIVSRSRYHTGIRCIFRSSVHMVQARNMCPMYRYSRDRYTRCTTWPSEFSGYKKINNLSLYSTSMHGRYFRPPL